jgi:hypothetical protein
MVAVWIIAVIVAGAVVSIVAPICVVQWARVRRVEANARLKQDMLARGLSVEDIERLNISEDLRKTQITADKQVREAQIAADTEMKRVQVDAELKRDLLAQGHSVEEVVRLTMSSPAASPMSPAASQSRPDALVLATAMDCMVQTGEDTKAIAGLLTAFLEQHSGPQETAQQSKSPAASPSHPDTLGLAAAVESMVQAGKDEKEIAALLAVFLGRPAVPPRPAPESNPTLLRWSAPGRIEECGSSSQPEHERRDAAEKRVESIIPAERRRE